MCDMVTVDFLSNGKAVTGGTNGFIYLWNENKCEVYVQIHANHAANHTLRVVGNTILAGGSDKKLHILVGEEMKITKSYDMEATPRAVDMNGEKVVVGCRDGSIVEINPAYTKKLMESHSEGEVWGLTLVPDNPNLLITVGDDNKVKVWDVGQKLCVTTTSLETNAGPERKPGYGASTLARTSPNQ